MKSHAVPLAVAFFLALTPLLTTTICALPLQDTIEGQRIASAVNYLVANYNRTIGLIHESPDSDNFSDTYWLYSDNYLALQAFSMAQADNFSVPVTMSNVSRTMALYLQGQPNPLNQYLVLSTGLWPFNNTRPYTFGTAGGAVIKSTVNNQSGTESPLSYADIAFLQAIAYHQNGESQYALEVYHDGVAFWDGHGFNDSATHATYATYKLALYILASKALGMTPDNSTTSRLLSLQLGTGLDSGGFATGYTSGGAPAGGTNTETTSLCILALLQPVSSPVTAPSNPNGSQFMALIPYIFLIMVVGVILAYARKIT